MNPVGRSKVAVTGAALVVAALVGVPTASASPLDERGETVRDENADALHSHLEAVEQAIEALDDAAVDVADAESAVAAAQATVDAAVEQIERADEALSLLNRAKEYTSREAAGITERLGSPDGALGAVARSAFVAGSTIAEFGPFRYLAGEFATALELAEADHETATAALDAALADLETAEEAYAAAEADAEAARAAEREEYEALLAESEALEEWLTEYGSVEVIEGTGSFVRPATGRVTSPYGPRFHPILKYVRMHTGIDIGRGDGFIYAADHGTVVEATWSDGYGYYVVVDHGLIDGQQVATLYAHQPGLSVDIGDVVAKEQPIGSIGSTGLSTGPHLHFEVRIDGRPVDPAPWIADAPLPTTD